MQCNMICDMHDDTILLGAKDNLSEICKHIFQVSHFLLARTLGRMQHWVELWVIGIATETKNVYTEYVVRSSLFVSMIIQEPNRR